MSRRILLARAAAALGVVSATGGAPWRCVDAQPAPRRDLVIAQSGDVGRLDPHLSTAIHDTAITFNVFDTLVQRQRDGRLHPSLATNWRLLSPTAWEFRLRPDVTFHNGDPFTAADVKFGIERTYDPQAKTLVASVFTTIARIETPDPQTVVFHTRRPDPLLPARLASFGGQVLPRRYLERVGPEAFGIRPIGTGPLRLTEWIKGDRTVLERVPGYWGGAVDPTQVTFRPIPETAARLAALLRGEVDLITSLPPDHVDRVASRATTRVEETLYAGLYVLVVDSRRPPLDDPRIKQALSLAIDRTTILRDLWRGRGIVSNGPIPKGDSHHDDTQPPLRHDPGLARQRLREAGYRGEPIVLESGDGYTINDKAMSEIVVAMWGDVGINAKIEMLESSVINQKIREKSFKGLRWARPASTLGDPDGLMWRLLGPGGLYDTWRHPRFDELGEAARFSVDEGLRGRAYREMTAIFLEHIPWIPVIQPIEAYGVQRHVDWTPYPSQQIELRSFNLKLRRA
jgi:peptide/nickel transport system substrate-binding protein